MISTVTSCCDLPSQSSPEIAGEAAKQVSRDLRESHPQVPWSAAARMRDRLVHHYFDVNLDVLWSTMTDDLPRLLATLPDDLLGDGSAAVADDRPRVDE